MKKNLALFLAFLLCFACSFALAEDAYAPGARTQALVSDAMNAGQVVGGKLHVSLDLPESMQPDSDDAEGQAQFDALMEVVNGVSLAGGLGKLDDGYRLELGGAYTASSGDNVFVTGAANLTGDGVSLESNLIEGERLSVKWETLLEVLGLSEDEIQQILALKDVDWNSAADELTTALSEMGAQIGQLSEPYLATLADFVSTLDIQQRSDVAAESGYPAVDHEIAITCTAQDLGRLVNTLADQMEKDSALLPYLEQFIANVNLTVTDSEGNETYVMSADEFFASMRSFAETLLGADGSIGILVGYNDDSLPFYLTLALTSCGDTSALLFQLNPGETENTYACVLTALESDEDGELTGRTDITLDLALDPNDFRVFNAELAIESADFNMNLTMAEQAVTTADNYPGYQTTFAVTMTAADGGDSTRYVYSGDSLTRLTDTDGEQTTFSMNADVYDNGTAFIVAAESGQLVEPKDGHLSGRFYMNETFTIDDEPLAFGLNVDISSWDYDAAETAALQETVFEAATGEELAALQNRFAMALQEKLVSLMSLVPPEVLQLLNQ